MKHKRFLSGTNYNRDTDNIRKDYKLSKNNRRNLSVSGFPLEHTLLNPEGPSLNLNKQRHSTEEPPTFDVSFDIQMKILKGRSNYLKTNAFLSSVYSEDQTDLPYPTLKLC